MEMRKGTTASNKSEDKESNESRMASRTAIPDAVRAEYDTGGAREPNRLSAAMEPPPSLPPKAAMKHDTESTSKKGARNTGSITPGAESISPQQQSVKSPPTERIIDAKASKAAKSTATITPGAVAVSPGENKQQNVVPPAAVPATHRDLATKSVKGMKNTGETAPGAVAVSTNERDPPSSEPPAALTLVQSDPKRKTGKGIRNTGTTKPGATEVSTEHDEGPPSMLASTERDVEKISKKGARNAGALIPGAVGELQQKSAETPSADTVGAGKVRSKRRTVRSTEPGARAVVEDEPVHEPTTMDRSAEHSLPLPPVPSNIGATTRQRMEAKILQMEHEQEGKSHQASITEHLAGRDGTQSHTGISGGDDTFVAGGLVGTGITTIIDRGVSAVPDVIAGDPDALAFKDKEGLSVAIPVTETDEDSIPRVHGTEYDPDSKPPLYRNRRVQSYGCCLVFIVVVIVAGTLAGVLTKRSPEPAAPTMAPTTFREQQYLNVFADALGIENISELSESQLLAAEWMINSDPMMLSTASKNLVQRYILVLFYYEMSQNGQHPWRSCNPPREDEDDNCTFYESYAYNYNRGSESATFTPRPGKHRWLSGADECEWAGVVCDETKFVAAINLAEQNLTGTLPTELLSLSSLVFLAIPFNEITGTIPDEYKRLLYLALQFNLLTGQFSDSWYQSAEVLFLNVGGNMLTGSLATELGLLTNLKSLFLFQNSITGSIPTEIGKLNFMENLYLNDNPFEGSIPTEIGQLQALKKVWLYNNRLSGTIPSEIGLLTNMTDFQLNSNNISGTIPEEFWNMTNLEDLGLRDMNLIGTLSTRIGDLKKLIFFVVQGNQLTGTIPTELALLTDLKTAWLHFNDFTGTVPSELCKNRGPASQDQLEFLNADCGPEGSPVNECDCCTSCCDRQAQTCKNQ